MGGLNIFTDAFNRMKYIFISFCFFITALLNAQVTIHADVTSGCYPLKVSFTLQPANALDTITSVSWDFGNGKTSVILSPEVTYDSTGIFTISCLINGTTTITSTDLIRVAQECLIVPNVFSPNEDNINDIFEVKTDGINVYTFSVYTRSGTLIYKTESPSIQWDGRSFSGHKMRNGIYFYIIRQLESKPLNEVKGIVYLFE